MSIVYVFNSYPAAAKTLTPLNCVNFSEAELRIYKNIRHIHRNINTATLTKTELGTIILELNILKLYFVRRGIHWSLFIC